MKTYIYSVTQIRDGELGYSGVSEVFTDEKTAKEFATKQVKYQADLWGVTPTLYRVAKGSFVQYEVKHKEQDLKMYYTLQVINK